MESLSALLERSRQGDLPAEQELYERLRQYVRSMVQAQDPLPLRRHDPAIPRDLETICLKCLSKAPRQHYASAGELADDLGFMRGRPVLVRPLGNWGRLCRRRPLAAGLSALTLVSLVAATAISMRFGLVAARERRQAVAARNTAEQSAHEAQRHEQHALAKLARSQSLLYASRSARAQQAWDNDDVAAAWDSLAACEPSLRGWEYDFLVARMTANQRTLTGHQRQVMSVAFSPDGRRLVTGSWDATAAEACRRRPGVDAQNLERKPLTGRR